MLLRVFYTDDLGTPSFWIVIDVQLLRFIVGRHPLARSDRKPVDSSFDCGVTDLFHRTLLGLHSYSFIRMAPDSAACRLLLLISSPTLFTEPRLMNWLWSCEAITGHGITVSLVQISEHDELKWPG